MHIVFLLFQVFFAVFFFFLCLAFLTGAPFVPSTNPTSTAMIALADIKPGSVVYDLGSGNGKLLFLAAQRGATATGYEINPFLVVLTALRVFFSRYRNKITVYWKNFWHGPLVNADVVFVYLLPWRMEQLEAKLLTELKPGARVVSNSFIFPGWPIASQDLKAHVYVFVVPAPSLTKNS